MNEMRLEFDALLPPPTAAQTFLFYSKSTVHLCIKGVTFYFLLLNDKKNDHAVLVYHDALGRR